MSIDLAIDKAVESAFQKHLEPLLSRLNLTPAAPEDPKMRPEEAGEYINVKPSTLRWWRCMGYGPAFHKYGNAVRYLKSDLDKFIAETVSVKHNGRPAPVAPVRVEPTTNVKRGRGRPRKWVKVAVSGGAQ